MSKRTTVLSRAVVTAATIAMLAGPAAVPAGAAPEPTQVTAAASAAAVPESTMEDKVRAAAVLGILAGDDLLVLSDRNFVIALWRQASSAEVRASAELAFAGTDLECTQWIKTGLAEAKTRDDAQEIRDAEIAREARELKQRAAATIGITAEPELLIQSYQDFVYALWQRASGPKVKAAALVAFGGDEDTQKEFLLTGIVTAHAQDQQDRIDADQQASAEEKARLAARDAKANAAAVLGIVATESLLVLSDENFVREIWNRAVPGSEVAAAAETALRSSIPADWKAFIDTGIYAANKRDIAIALQKKADADRKRLLELKTKAQNSGVHPALVAAANIALAGSATGIDRFLRIGQYEDAVLRQSLQGSAAPDRGAAVRGKQGAQATVAFGAAAPNAGDGLDATWKVIPGKANADCHTFESVKYPNTYLRQNSFKVLVAASDGSDKFAKDATWCTKSVSGGVVVLESKGAPGRFLRNFDGLVYAANDGGGANAFDAKAGFATDRAWVVGVADPATSAIQRRWLNDDAIRTRVGNPVADEQVDGDLHYRDYQKGRLTWSSTVGVKEMEGKILAKYTALDGLHHASLGAPRTDETVTANVAGGRYNDFAGGGSIYWSSATGAHLTYGVIKTRWQGKGGPSSEHGFPTSDVMALNPGPGQCQNFQHGSITLKWPAQVVFSTTAKCATGAHTEPADAAETAVTEAG